MSTRVWLSYDLTVRGDYESLYYWLDKNEAKECGNSVATFLWNPTNISEIRSEIKESLKESVSFGKKDKIYLVFRKPDNSYKGSFIIGKRRSSPWEGASEGISSDDE